MVMGGKKWSGMACSRAIVGGTDNDISLGWGSVWWQLVGDGLVFWLGNIKQCQA